MSKGIMDSFDPSDYAAPAATQTGTSSGLAPFAGQYVTDLLGRG